MASSIDWSQCPAVESIPGKASGALAAEEPLHNGHAGRLCRSTPLLRRLGPRPAACAALKGTRIPVSAIFENIEAGANIDNIMEWFDGLDCDQVKAVIEFVARSLDEASEYAPAPTP